MVLFFLFFEWKDDDKNVLDILYCQITPLPAMKADADVFLDVPYLSVAGQLKLDHL